jgi:GNAT superfamily N-acetyltransferase
MRLTWGKALFRGEDRLRERLWDDPPSTHFVRAAGNLLVSHAEVLQIDAAGRDARRLRIGGVTAVMTYPPFRRQGHASAVMRRVVDHIYAKADIGLLFTDHEHELFYQRLGWRMVDASSVLVRGQHPDDLVMSLGDTSVLPNVLRHELQW